MRPLSPAGSFILFSAEEVSRVSSCNSFLHWYRFHYVQPYHPLSIPLRHPLASAALTGELFPIPATHSHPVLRVPHGLKLPPVVQYAASVNSSPLNFLCYFFLSGEQGLNVLSRTVLSPFSRSIQTQLNSKLYGFLRCRRLSVSPPNGASGVSFSEKNRLPWLRSAEFAVYRTFSLRGQLSPPHLPPCYDSATRLSILQTSPSQLWPLYYLSDPPCVFCKDFSVLRWGLLSFSFLLPLLSVDPPLPFPPPRPLKLPLSGLSDLALQIVFLNARCIFSTSFLFLGNFGPRRCP